MNLAMSLRRTSKRASSTPLCFICQLPIFVVVKRGIPESIFTGPRGEVDSRSWDAAIDVVQQSLLGMAAGDDVTDQEDRILTAVFRECEELRAQKYLESVLTNRGIAKKYAICPRTVTNWRKAGCPFEDGQWRCS